jgi:ectoine hydroxylase-related dioxygenase (phytanoyl-CoA dioxygenase family)
MDAITTIEEAVNAAGVSEKTLPASKKRALDEEGYVVLTSVVGTGWLASLRTAFESVAAAERRGALAAQTGTRHPRDLLNFSPAFDGACVEPRVFAAVHHVL